MSIRQTPPGRGSSVASIPIQRTIFTGSVKYSNTASGGAATRTSCSTTLVSARASATAAPPLVLLDDLLEAREAPWQHVGEEAVKVIEALRAHAVEAAGAVAPLAHEPGLLQHLQMLGDRRLRDLEARGDVTRAQLAAGQQPKDLAPLGLCDRLEDLHAAMK